jgi:hypothetical protein
MEGRSGRPRPKTTLTIARYTALFAVLSALLAGAAVALPGGAKYLGETDQGGAVSLRLSGDATRVRRFRIHYTVTCNNGKKGKPTYTDVLETRLERDGSFKGEGSYQGSVENDLNKFKVSGKVTKRKAHGTFSLTSKGGDTRCKTGKLSWSARREK